MKFPVQIFCVWPILWSAMVLMDYLPVELPPSFFPFLSNIHPLNLTFLSAIFYGSVYILMDKKYEKILALWIKSDWNQNYTLLTLLNVIELGHWQQALYFSVSLLEGIFT